MSVRVELGRQTSEIFQGTGCRHRLLSELAQAHPRRVVIADEMVHRALGSKFPELFASAETLLVPAGETSKDLPRCQYLWSALCRLGADRGTAILAVGGGMITDLAGFVAATYLRGLPFYSCPTSLLAMVDASVGGKVGIDLAEGKNLVGQFYPARAVAIDPELLDSLPPAEWASGMAEVIKHAILSGGELWHTVRSESREALQRSDARAKLLRDAVAVKLKVVAEDPYETTGLRATLNLGHTFGHALEWSSQFELRHGEAVALGMLAALRLSRSLGLLEKDFEADLLAVLRRWSLPIGLPEPRRSCWAWEPLEQALSRDKKTSSGAWNFILPHAPGRVGRVSAPDPVLVRQAFSSLRTEVAEVTP